MISRDEAMMQSRKIFGAVAVGACAALLGCSEEPQAAAPVKQTYVAPEPELGPLDEIDLDSRVQFPEERAPAERAQTEAVAALASSIAAGDSDALRGLLESNYRVILSGLVDDGGWSDSTGAIEAVRVCTLEHDAEMLRVGLGIQDSRGAYLLAWNGVKSGDGWLFEPIAIESQYAASADALDDAPLISPQIAEAEFEIAPEPKEEEKKRTQRRGKGGRGGTGLKLDR